MEDRQTVAERRSGVRAVVGDDLPFLWEMLYEAAAVSPEIPPLGKEAALARPELARYLVGWGRPGDAGVIAVRRDGARLGAAWYRLFPEDDPGYGFVAADVPELAIGVAAEARGRGIGSALLEELMGEARRQGFAALSLSVQRHNPALRLYRRVGFQEAGAPDPEESAVTMIARL